MAADDDRLLDALAVALRPPPAQPSSAERAALDRTVAGAAGARRGARVRRRLLAVAAVVMTGTGGTAYANSPSSPREVRSLAHAMKVPGVEAPDLTDARKALDDLEEEVAEGRPAKVRAAVEDVREELEELSVPQRSRLEPRLTTLLDAAAGVAAAPAEAEEPEEPEDPDDRNDGERGRRRVEGRTSRTRGSGDAPGT